MTEEQLCLVNGLVARFYHTDNRRAKLALQRRIYALGIILDFPEPTPAPWTPTPFGGGLAA
jgi:hypothetical protein